MMGEGIVYLKLNVYATCTVIGMLYLKFTYHNTIVRLSCYTLSIDASNVYMINDLATRDS